MMGVVKDDCFAIAEMLGIRTISVAGVAYLSLSELMKNSERFESYTSLYNDTWVYRGRDIYLQHWNTTLQGGIISVS